VSLVFAILLVGVLYNIAFNSIKDTVFLLIHCLRIDLYTMYLLCTYVSFCTFQNGNIIMESFSV